MRTASETRRRRREERIRAIKRLGGCCARCGFSDWRALQFDHVDGGGTRELSKKGYRTAYNLDDVWRIGLNEDKKFQLLCANCNTIKKFENNEGCKDDLNSYFLSKQGASDAAQSQGSPVTTLGGDSFVVGCSSRADV